MSEDTGTAPKPPARHIRGPERIQLVVDLASGEYTHEVLGKKYGRTKQTIHEFSARNADEIRQAREQISEELSAELRGVTIAVKANRIKWGHSKASGEESRGFAVDLGISDGWSDGCAS